MTDYDNIPTIVQPQNLDISLYKHQLASVYNMEKLEQDKKIVEGNIVKETDFGVNADPTGYGKCVGLNTPILMYDGSIKMVQDVKVGDLLMGDDSNPRKVSSLSRGREMMYKVIQKTGGEDYRVNESHILSLKMSQPVRIKERKGMFQVFYFDSSNYMFRSKSFAFSSYEGWRKQALKEAQTFSLSLKVDPHIDIELKDYLRLSKHIRRDLKGYRVGVDFKHKEVILDPYILGLWLGDSTFTSTEITTNDKDITDKLLNYCTENNFRLSMNGLKQYITDDTRHETNRFLNMLKKIGVYNNKHIPIDYKTNSRKIRLLLLAGLLDSDGYYKNGVYEIVQKRQNLANDIVYLTRSLGFRSHVKSVLKSCMYKNEKRQNTYYKVTISGKLISDIPLILQHKKATTQPNKDQLCTDISIVQDCVDDYYGFTIDGNRRFLLGDFTVTHNTLSMVTLVLRDKMEWDLETPHEEITYNLYASNRFVKKRYRTYTKLPTTLIVTNQSIIKQWIKEFSHTDLDVVPIMTKKDAMSIDPNCYDVILITCTMYNTIVNRFSEFAWKRFIFDEPGHVKIPSMAKIRAGFTWLVTATPQLVYNLHRRCKNSMMTDLLEGINYDIFEDVYADIIIKNDPEFTALSFSMPETHHEYYHCYDPMFKTVQGLVNDRVADMISAGNIQEAVKALGGKETDNVVDLVRRGKEEELQATVQNIQAYTHQDNEELVKKYKEKKKRIEEQLVELEKRFEMLLNGDCPICCCKMANPVMEPKCQNIFCGNCIFEWIKSEHTCPMCRQDINNQTLVYINTEAGDGDSNNENIDEGGVVTKFKQIESILEDNPDGRYIIFSAYDKTFSGIRTFLKDKDITFAEISGSVHTRNKTIDRFKEGNIKVLFLNSRNNGSGINLQEATDIILYHEMNDDTVKQVIGRANRIGREESLYVHHLISV